MQEALEKIKIQATEEIKSVREPKDLEKWRVKFLGRKSTLSLFLRQLKKLPLKERKSQGKEANQLKQFLHSLFQQTKQQLVLQKESCQFDITRPGIKPSFGHLHPLTLTIRQIVNAFRELGFEVVEGPEIETEYYNFDALRIPPDHPARDMWDTFWLNSPKNKEKSLRFLLRTHTSPVQIRYMEKHQPPLRIIVPGKCFRHEATDSSHDFQFHQIEGLMIGEEVSLANFKSVIEDVLKKIFSDDTLIRFRPSYFPFVTPGVEIDIRLPGQTRNQWLEIMGAGMVHPELFDSVGYDKNIWQGFAFGLGVERIAMIKYHIPDIRLFSSPDIRFLRQF